jgi:hypothetical protein
MTSTESSFGLNFEGESAPHHYPRSLHLLLHHTIGFIYCTATYTHATMSAPRIALRTSRMAVRSFRQFTTSAARFNDTNHRANDTAEEYRKIQSEKPLNPHLTNTNSTIANEMPSLGKDNPPPEMITSVDPDFVPKDSVPENTERMTGGTQKGAPESGVNAELDVGEIEGGTFKVEPLRRSGEDAATMRARLTCMSLPIAPVPER